MNAMQKEITTKQDLPKFICSECGEIKWASYPSNDEKVFFHPRAFCRGTVSAVTKQNEKSDSQPVKALIT